MFDNALKIDNNSAIRICNSADLAGRRPAALLAAASVRQLDAAPAAGRHAAEQPRVGGEAARGHAEAAEVPHHAELRGLARRVHPEAEPDGALGGDAAPAVLLAQRLRRRPPGEAGAGPGGLEAGPAQPQSMISLIHSHHKSF